MSTFSSIRHELYLLSSQMFIEHSKCGSRLTSSVLRLTPPSRRYDGTARCLPHLQHTMYCADSVPGANCLLSTEPLEVVEALLGVKGDWGEESTCGGME